jgi:glycosyltransferase involved in cell wall biosynthesis
MRIPEYLASHRPLITTAVPDVPEYLVDGEHACVAAPGDAEDLADRICRLADDRAEAIRIARNGFLRGRFCFDYRQQSQRLLGFLQEHAAARRRWPTSTT